MNQDRSDDLEPPSHLADIGDAEAEPNTTETRRHLAEIESKSCELQDALEQERRLRAEKERMLAQLEASKQQLLDSEEKLRTILDHSPMAIYASTGIEQVAVYVNDTFTDLFGYTLEELPSIARWWPLAYPDADYRESITSEWQARVQQAIETQSQIEPMEVDVTCKDGSRKNILWGFVATGLQNWAFGLDLTSRKRAEDALKESEQRFRQVVETLPQLVWTCDAEGPCDYLSPQWIRYTGKPESEQLGYGWLEQLHPDDRQRTIDHWMATAAQGLNFEIEFRIRRHDGTYHWFRTLAVPLRDQDGRIVKWFGSNTDIDDIRQAHEEIEQLNADLEHRVAVRTAQLRQEKLKAEAANQAKSSFLATMSHEIRTPLNAIVGTSYTLGQSRLDADQRRQLATIESASRNLLAQINDILDLDKIEAGEVALERAPFEITSLLDDLAHIFGPQTQAKGIAFLLPDTSQTDLPLLVGDPYKIQQLLTNLIGNAIKFTDRGNIGVGLEVIARDADHLTLRFSVTDTGIGIDTEVLPTLFQPFTQGDASTTRVHGGTGLGLSLVRRMSERMGGEAGVESQLGKGSTFWFQIPLDIASPDIAPGRGTTPTHNLRILIADDEPSDRQSIVALATELGWRVEVVEDGDSLVRRLADERDRHPAVDCVLIDWCMPGLDGLQALAELRHRIDPPNLPAVIMISAADRDTLLDGIAEANVSPDSLLTKPIGPTELFNAVNTAVAAHAPWHHVLSATRIRSHHSYWLADIRVLVVDDSLMNLEVCQRLLTHEGAKPTLCDSGTSALQAVAADPTAFDIVLTDVRMPGMDGYETTRRLRDLLGDARLPIIALTAGALASERAEAEQAGMDGFLTKPIDPMQLIRAIRRHVEGIRGQPLPLVARAEHADAISVTQWPNIAALDLEPVRTRLAGDRSLFLNLLDHFLDDSADLLGQARQALDSDTADRAAPPLHRLRGQAANIGAMDLSQTLGRLEREALAGRLSATALQTTDMELAQLREQLNAWRDAYTQPQAPSSGTTATAALEPAALKRLKSQLANQSMAALATYETLSQTLSDQLDPAVFVQLQEAMGDLDFKTALSRLETLDAPKEQRPI